MAEMYAHYFIGIRCDARGCGLELEAPESSSWKAEAAFWRKAVALGWTAWASRSRRCYCPNHKPSQGHRMRDVTPKASFVASDDPEEVSGQ